MDPASTRNVSRRSKAGIVIIRGEAFFPIGPRIQWIVVSQIHGLKVLVAFAIIGGQVILFRSATAENLPDDHNSVA